MINGLFKVPQTVGNMNKQRVKLRMYGPSVVSGGSEVITKPFALLPFKWLVA